MVGTAEQLQRNRLAELLGTLAIKEGFSPSFLEEVQFIGAGREERCAHWRPGTVNSVRSPKCCSRFTGTMTRLARSPGVAPDTDALCFSQPSAWLGLHLRGASALLMRSAWVFVIRLPMAAW